MNNDVTSKETQYALLNLHAFNGFGEFKCMRDCGSTEVLSKWNQNFHQHMSNDLTWRIAV